MRRETDGRRRRSAAARARLVRHDHHGLEPRLDALLDALGHNGAREIWHKHGTFLDHLLGVWRVLLEAGRERSWPTDALGIISLGEVRPGL